MISFSDHILGGTSKAQEVGRHLSGAGLCQGRDHGQCHCGCCCSRQPMEDLSWPPGRDPSDHVTSDISFDHFDISNSE